MIESVKAFIDKNPATVWVATVCIAAVLIVALLVGADLSFIAAIFKHMFGLQ